MKPSLTFILPILILALSSCSSSPVVKNINYADNSQQLFIDSKINNQVAISDKDKGLLRDILNNLFLYKGLNDGDLIILEAYIEKDLKLLSGERKLVPTGVSVAMPNNFEIQIRPRSGLAYKNGISVVNTPGTIDSDYRGEIKVLLINLGTEAVTIKKFQRIAQMVICPIIKANLKEVQELPETIRGAGGFGSTGQ